MLLFHQNMMEVTETEGLELRFQRAAARMRTNSALRLGNDQKLQLYGYFKQANEGTCNAPRPGFFDFTGRAKWEAWTKLGDLSKQEAMEKYLQLVDSLDPNWELQPTDPAGTPPPTSGDSVMGGPVMSRCVEEKEDVIPDKLKTVFDWCKEGHVTNMIAMVTEENINETCENGLTLLHWACDRGHLEVVKFLVSAGADVNRQDPDQQTPLHYAASCDHHGVVSHLLSAGADRTIKDCDGYLPEEQASDPVTRQLFQQQS